MAVSNRALLIIASWNTGKIIHWSLTLNLAINISFEVLDLVLFSSPYLVVILHLLTNVVVSLTLKAVRFQS